MHTLYLVLLICLLVVTLLAAHMAQDAPRNRVQCPGCGLRNKLSPPPCAYCGRKDTFLRVTRTQPNERGMRSTILSVGCPNCQPITLYTAKCKSCSTDLTTYTSRWATGRRRDDRMQPRVPVQPQLSNTAWLMEAGTVQPEEDVSGIA